MWWLPAAGLLAVGMLIYVTSALHVLNISPVVVGAQEIARDDAVREALAQHTAPVSLGNSRVAPTIRLQVDGPQGAAPLDIPVPPDARLSEARTADDGRASQRRDRAVLITSGDVAEVLAFYRAELADRDWHEVRSWMSRPAHGAPGAGGAVSAFCRGTDTPALLVGVTSRESGPSEIRLLLDPEDPGLCTSSVGPDPWNGSPPPVL
jgi:hypothetical protein